MAGARVITVTRHGGPEVLAERSVDVPSPGPGEVIVRTRAVGINFADIFARMGLYDAAPPPPFVPGFEAAGVVEAVGSGVSGVGPGDRVVGLTRFGGYTTHLRVPAWLCVPLPGSASFEEGAAFPTVTLTAYYALHVLGRVHDGMRVLVHAAAGGVGIAALQLLKRHRVEVYATVGSSAKIETVRREGAAHVIDYRTQDFEAIVREATRGHGVDLVLDSIGGECLRRSYRLLAPMGHLIAFGAASMMPATPRPRWARLAWQYLTRPRLDPLAMIGENRSVSGFNLVHLTASRPMAEQALATLAGLWRDGALRPVVGERFPFDRAGDAQEALRSRRTVGKVVLVV